MGTAPYWGHCTQTVLDLSGTVSPPLHPGTVGPQGSGGWAWDWGACIVSAGASQGLSGLGVQGGDVSDAGSDLQ